MLSADKQGLAAFLDGHAPYFEEIADRIWEHAELSLKEYASAALYLGKLRELGFTVTEKLCGIDTAFCGSYGSGRPVIGILGEFDALSMIAASIPPVRAFLQFLLFFPWHTDPLPDPDIPDSPPVYLDIRTRWVNVRRECRIVSDQHNTVCPVVVKPL